MTEGRKEVLRHRSIVAKLFGIVANEVPARKLQATNLSQHFFSIHRLKVFLLGLVRTSSKRHLTFDHRDRIVSQADLIAGVDDGFSAEGRSVGQIPSRHISSGPDGCIETANAVVKERIESTGSVGAARSVAKEPIASGGGILATRGVAIERTDSAGGVIVARGVAKERIESTGRVVVTRGIAIECIDSAGAVPNARDVTQE